MTAPAKTFEDLIVWQKAHKFVLSVYNLSQQFPQTEQYGLTSQMRRSAMSIPANIAEGFRKKSFAEKARFLRIAHPSLEETRYYLILTQDLGYADCTEMKETITEVSKLLTAYRKKIEST